MDRFQLFLCVVCPDVVQRSGVEDGVRQPVNLIRPPYRLWWAITPGNDDLAVHKLAIPGSACSRHRRPDHRLDRLLSSQASGITFPPDQEQKAHLAPWPWRSMAPPWASSAREMTVWPGADHPPPRHRRPGRSILPAAPRARCAGVTASPMAIELARFKQSFDSGPAAIVLNGTDLSQPPSSSSTRSAKSSPASTPCSALSSTWAPRRPQQPETRVSWSCNKTYGVTRQVAQRDQRVEPATL